jgi:3-hydroxyisobutyrate dehydrogenase-like beta-hydroxyacid dehydrogenase
MGNSPRIGFIGLGAMGSGMASNLLAKHGQLNITGNRNRDPVEKLLARGAQEYPGSAALAASSDVVILCLPDSQVVERVVADMGAALEGRKILIDTGTSSLLSTRRIAAELAERGVDFAEAPLTGGIRQAAAGALGALVGASPEVFGRVAPVLRGFCVSVQHFGPVGAGARAKFVNNYMVMGMVALVTEAFHIAGITGSDWDKLYDVVIRGSADSGVFRRIIGNARNGDFGGYVFNVGGALKDMTYITEMNASLGRATPLNRAILEFFADAVKAGHGEQLMSELLRPEIRESLFPADFGMPGTPEK